MSTRPITPRPDPEHAPPAVSPAARGEHRVWSGVALLAVLVLAAALRWTWPAAVADLRPRPDALEYEEVARSLVAGRGYLLWIANRAFPPRYPPGMSALIAATMPLLGTERGVGIWVVLASALVTIVVTFALARRVAGPVAGIVAALLVALSPLHVSASQYVMSDVPATALVAVIGYATFVVLDRRATTLACFALGVACGAAVCIRQPVAPIGLAAWLAVGLLSSGDLNEHARRMALVAAGGLVGVAPLLWVNWRLFGSPLRSGYGYWAPQMGFALDRATAPRTDGRASNLVMYGSSLVGAHTLYPWTGGVLLALGAVAGVRLGAAPRRLCALATVVGVPYLAVLLAYSSSGTRLILPLLPLLTAVMALCCADGAARSLRWPGLALIVATALLVLGPRRDLLLPPVIQGKGDVAALERLARLTERNAVILAYTDPFAFEDVLRRAADRVWVPLRADDHQLTIGLRKLQPVATAGDGSWLEPPIGAPLDRERLVTRVAALCASGRPVYLSAHLAGAVSFFPDIERTLRARWTLHDVAGAVPWVHRIDCDAPRDAQTP
jgi:4-amino-4-deoxy-L-arabinose transferase-like glycosyltransferase